MRTKIHAAKEKYLPKDPMHRKLLKRGSAGIMAFFLIGFLYHSFCYVSTDDAFVEGHVIPISPKVSSHVAKVFVDDNQKVMLGDRLVELDPKDFDVRHQAAQADLEAAKAEAEQAKRDLERYTQLSKDNEISKQQLDRAELRSRTADAQASAAVARLAQATLDVSYTKILAPVSGHVTRKAVEEGAFVQIGQPLMAIVSDEKWVVANFKETQLAHMRPGQKVKIKIDTYPGKTFKGHVESIQRGTGARFSMFPAENATGNYVKVVQRVPVKIVFDKQPDEKKPLGVGMSVVPDVKVRG